MAVYGYVRVSSKEQNVDRQLAALEPYQIPAKNMYIDKKSGKDFNRPSYRKMMRRIKKGDLIVVKSIDRLGRNYDEIITQWQIITREIKADIKVIDMELLDTRKKDGNLTGVLIADMVLQILAYVAQTEREFIHERQAEGIAIAKAKGIVFGRKRIEVPKEFGGICQQLYEGRISVSEAVAATKMSRTTFERRYEEWIIRETKCFQKVDILEA